MEPIEDKAFLAELHSLKAQLSGSETFEIPQRVKNVVIAGMGGSGIAGHIFSELYSQMPVTLVDDYSAPLFADEDTLFIGISYSGNTEETIAATKAAQSQGAHTVAITSGGTLSTITDQCISIPKGLQPRSATGYMVVPLLRSFDAVSDQELKEASDLVKRIDEDNSVEGRIAKEIFEQQKIPVIYGIPPYKTVAYRWKTQFNENAKVLAYSSSFPELNHNDSMALKGTYRKEEFYFIVFEDGMDKQIAKRIDATERITDIKFRRITANGESQFARIMGLIHRGDYVTYRLAQLRGVNPTDVAVIEELKRRIK